ncbi:MAG: putative Ig domain-containing protein [Deltaproteobacteria bacterium]|nr:putative Ig domain-containing protein [Deltaproteobacteria bacterium]
MSKLISSPALLLLSVFASTAEAQYVTGSRSEPFVDLSNIPGVTSIGQVTFNDADDGYSGAIPIGFTFNFFSSNFTTVYASTDGFISFGPLTNSYYSNTSFGDPSSPNAIIAAVWDDLELPSVTSARYATFGTAPDRVFVIEVTGFTPTSSPGDAGSWQIWLYEGLAARFEIRIGHGPFTQLYTASIGYEGATGAGGTRLAPCTPNCRTADLNSAVGTAYFAFKPTGPELSGTFTTVPRAIAPGAADNVVFSLRNTGPQAAAGVDVDLILSADQTLDPTDSEVGSGAADVAASGQTAMTIPVTVPAGLPVADYYVFASVDPSNAVSEVVETDNTPRAATRIATGPDFVPGAVQAVRDARPGDPIDFQVSINQTAVAYSGPLEVEILVSRDAVRDAGDISVGVFSIELTGTSTTVVVHATLPSRVAVAAHLPILVIDPNARVTQVSTLNDVLVGNRPFITGNDLSVRAITFPTQIPNGGTFALGVDVGVSGPPYTGNVELDLYASTDAVLSLNDTLLSQSVVSIAGETSKVLTETHVLPALPPGSYAIIARVDPDSLVTELDETNNIGVSVARFLNAHDFRISAVTAPAGADPGDNITVRATIQSLGVDYPGSVPYRVLFSNDNQLSTDDVIAYEASVTLAGASTVVDATFPVPGVLRVQSYTVIVVVNPDGVIPESVSTNNVTASTTTLRVRGSDLRANAAEGPEYGFAGHEYPVAVTIVNQGEAMARGFRYSVRISDNDTIRLTDPEIFLSSVLDLPAGEETTFEAIAMLPAATSTSTKYIGVLVDVYSNVPETQEGNNIRVIPHPIRVLQPIPNLTGELVSTPTAAAAGERLAITRLLQNDGVAPSTFEYVYYLSTNAVLSPDDLEIGRLSTTVDEGTFDFGIDIVDVPPGISAGAYYVGVALDPSGAVEEISEDDNAFTLGPLHLYGSTIEIRTDRLSDATLGVPYEAGLFAVGGAVGIAWSVSAGRLPNGIELEPSGLLRGTPTEEGLFELTLRAASGSTFTERALTLRVISPTVPLAIVSSALPTALSGRTYSAELVAIGGVPPYQWTALVALPDGLALSESGVLSGTVPSRGNFRITVRVRDALGDSAAKDLALNAINPDQGVAIVQRPLFSATAGQEYCDPDPVELEARGGIPPYKWAAIEGLPEGMSLTAAGRLCGTPARVGTFQLLVRAQDENGLFDTSLLVLEVEGGTELSISTTELDPATVGVAYSVGFTAIRGVTPYAWAVVYGSLPAGLALASTGELSGTPTGAGAFAFAIRVTDEAGRADLRPFSIIVAEATKPITPDEDGCGCNTTQTPRTPLFGALMLLGMFVLRTSPARRRTRKGSAALFATLTLAATSTDALAQTVVPGTPYVVTRRNAPFTPLANPTVVFSSGVDDDTDNVTLPFAFKFYDSNFDAVSVGSNGAIIMGPGGSVGLSGATPGSSSTPNGWIAGLWDDLKVGSGGHVGYQVFGTAPTRSVVFEWRDVDPYGEPGDPLNFQIALHEGPSGKILLHYGAAPTSGTVEGVMAMEDPAGARAIYFDAPPSPCTSNCRDSDLAAVANTEIEYVVDAGVELAALGITVPRYGFLGGQIATSVTVANLHSTPIGPFRYAVEVLEGTTAHRVFESSPTVLLGYETRTEIARPTLPMGLPEGAYNLRLVVDSASQIAEVVETNNTVTSPTQVRLVQGRADVAVDRVTSSSVDLEAGGSVAVRTTVSNPGAEDISGARVAIVLSSNPAISAEDLELGSFVVTLARGESRTTTTSVSLDARLNSGIYYLGAFADADDELDESDETNNGRVSSSVSVRGGSVAVATMALPAAPKGLAYSAVLSAVGGDGRYSWEISNGALPAGIGLVPGTGELFGRPSRAESATFTVRVTSQGLSASKELTLRVIEPETPLTVVTRKLPSAIVGQEYSEQLEAVGARSSAPTWSASELPEGLTLSDAGVLAGTAVSAGTSTITFTVADGQSTASRSFPFTIRDNANLLIQLEALDPAVFGQPYDARLLASGGEPPYIWIARGEMPEGLTLSTAGIVSGTPAVVGSFQIEIEVRDSAATPAIDTNVFIFTVNDSEGFSISTATLPAGFVNESYEALIETTGGSGPYDWAIEIGRLPKKLSTEVLPTSGAFQIAGVPEAVGDTNVLVRVTDAAGRRAYKPFVLRIVTRPVEEKPAEDTGCGCRAAERNGSRGTLASMLMLGATLALRARRRRH